MTVSQTFATFVSDQLTRAVGPIRSRRMFGGVGLYHRELFFALLDNDRLFLKADDENRDDFVSRGWPPFQPFGPGTPSMSYYEAPLEVIEVCERLLPVAQSALGAAQRAGTKKTKKKTKPTATKILVKSRRTKLTPTKKKTSSRKSVKANRRPPARSVAKRKGIRQ